LVYHVSKAVFYNACGHGTYEVCECPTGEINSFIQKYKRKCEE
jgi:hypothetical protein